LKVLYLAAGNGYANAFGLRCMATGGNGHTESVYLTDFLDIERPEGMRIVPELPGRIGHYAAVLPRAVELSENYDCV
jgi:hypothetical protein